MKISNYFQLFFLLSVSVLTLLLLLPARLHLNLSYEDYVEYLIYLNLLLVLYVILSQKLSIVLKLLFITLAFSFFIKYVPVFFKFYSAPKYYKNESIDTRINFVNHECVNNINNFTDGNIVFNINSNGIQVKNKSDFIIKENKKIVIDKGIFLEEFYIFSESKIHVYFFDFKNLKTKKLITRRVSSFLRHRGRSIIYLKNFSTPFSKFYRRFAKTSDFYNLLNGLGYPFLIGNEYKNHLFISKDIESFVYNYDLNCHFSVGLKI